MKQIDTKCKICEKPLSLQSDPDCEPHWLRVFTSMVTCDRCFDLRETRLKVTGKLQALAQYIMAIEATSIKPEDKMHKRRKARERLVWWTRKYAEWFSSFHHSPKHVVWSEDFADVILEKPDKLEAALRQYRDKARVIIREPIQARPA